MVILELTCHRKSNKYTQRRLFEILTMGASIQELPFEPGIALEEEEEEAEEEAAAEEELEEQKLQVSPYTNIV